jgi:hypothetical protein
MTQDEIWKKPCTPAEIMERLARKDVRKQLGMMAAGGRRLPPDQIDDLASEAVLAACEFLSTVAPNSQHFAGGKTLTLAALCKRLAGQAARRSQENPAHRKYTTHLVIRAKNPSKFQRSRKTVRQDEWKVPGERPSILDVLLGKPESKRDGAKAVKCGTSRRTKTPEPRFLRVVREGVVAPEGWGWGYKGVLEEGCDYYLAAEGAPPEFIGPSLGNATKVLNRVLEGAKRKKL